jgi:hypothetical protein
MWPAFVLWVVAGTVVLRLLPFAGDEGFRLVPAFLLCGFLGLAIVGALAPLGGWLLRRRDPSLPKVVAEDRAGTALLAGALAVLLLGGVLHRPAVEHEERELIVQADAARRAILAQAPGEFHRNIELLNTTKQGPDLYRSCVPGAGDEVAFCVLVFTDQSPPGVAVDPDRRPNEVVSGPRNPGRLGR